MLNSNGVKGTADKIKTLTELAAALGELRRTKKRIVHCHGVFDLLHIGHIRHLEQAKRMGDVLVVTLTPDQYVNKGPARPVFRQDLRAEAIAALDCVDYVALNLWPQAVRTIKLLRPDFYVKGPDYGKDKRDITGGIALEKRAVESHGGRLMITDDITFSSSNLINRVMPVLPKEAMDYLSRFSRRFQTADVLRYIEDASKLKVLVVGEAIIDEYRYCTAIGKSTKDPMLALQYQSSEKFAGGSLAVANNLANFCGSVELLTFLGEMNSQESFVRKSLDPRIRPHFLYKKDAPTIVKRRYIESYFFTKLLLIYEINDKPLQTRNNAELCRLLAKNLPRYDLVIVMDFGHGMMSPEAIDLVSEKSRFLAVNTQSNAGNQGFHTISLYPRADYLSMSETEFRLEARDRYKDLREVIAETARKLSCPNIIVTRGKYGSLAYGKDAGFVEAPSLAGQVVDRMGAGDASFALTAPCVVQKAPLEVVQFIGNAAGAQAVATVGHRQSVQRVPFFKHIETLLK